MTDLIIGAIVLAVVAAAGLYLRKAKKCGAKCIGCSACKGSCSQCSSRKQA